MVVGGCSSILMKSLLILLNGMVLSNILPLRICLYIKIPSALARQIATETASAHSANASATAITQAKPAKSADS